MSRVKRIIRAVQINLIPTILVLKKLGLSENLLTHTQKHTRISQTIKPLVSLHAAALVSVGHQFLLVLRYQAFKTISVPVFERLLCHRNLQKQR